MEGDSGATDINWLVTLLAVCFALLAPSLLIAWWLRKPAPRESLIHGEAGVSYSMAFVMALPVFLVVTMVWFEAGYLLLTKMATLQAAQAAARSAAVWLPTTLQDGAEGGAKKRAEEQIKWSATLAMTPFALAKPFKQQGSGPTGGLPGVAHRAGEAQAAYEKLSGTRAQSIPAKFSDADRRLQVRISPQTLPMGQKFREGSGDSRELDGQVEIEVTYSAPQFVRGLADVIQPGSRKNGYYTVKSKAKMPGEYPRNSSRSFSIPFKPLIN